MQGLVETTEHPRGDSLSPVLLATIHPDIKRTLVGMSERTGLTVSQVTDEVLYTGLLEMQELPDLSERPHPLVAPPGRDPRGLET